VKAQSGEAGRHILVQEFVPGREFALEGLLSEGKLHALALFDKPDPLDGPYFEETIYVTPSRLPEGDQTAIGDCVSMGARALGLREGPVHAEVRLNDRGPWLIELAARSIGGLCSRTLRFGTGLSLEEVILRHALGMPIEDLPRDKSAAGVMMIPIPRSGILKEIEGLDEARKVENIVEVAITARFGRPVVALPEGSSYLGFLFSRAGIPAEAEAALREAHRRLKIIIE
jgi:biotin carboxylase